MTPDMNDNTLLVVWILIFIAIVFKNRNKIINFLNNHYEQDSKSSLHDNRGDARKSKEG